MKLVNARLCLDCEEVHEEQHCPICGSESFAFMTRWVTPADTVAEPPAQQPRAPDGVERRKQLVRREQVDAYRQILEPDAGAPRPDGGGRSPRAGPHRRRADAVARGTGKKHRHGRV